MMTGGEGGRESNDRYRKHCEGLTRITFVHSIYPTIPVPVLSSTGLPFEPRAPSSRARARCNEPACDWSLPRTSGRPFIGDRTRVRQQGASYYH